MRHAFQKIARVSFSFLLILLRIIPYPAFRGLARIVFGVMYALSPKMRRIARESLDIAFGSAMSPEEKSRIAKSAYFNLSLGLADVARAASCPGFADRRFHFEGRENLDVALKKGKGAVLCIAHFGPFAAMVYKFIEAGYPVGIVMRPLRNQYFKDRIMEEGTRQGLNPVYSVPVRGCVLESLRALEAGRVLFMPVDQNYGSAGRIFVDFFGRKVGTAPGPVAYALKTGAPVLFAYALPLKTGGFRILIEPEIPLMKKATDRETLVYNMAVVTSRVEALVRQYPDQWSWMHRRWKAVPKDGEI
ncbi:MAG: lysophospholipid acyltransferase family protein [Candidatus Omnitrophica bacterium]|nr:lysophospholipid acyltransferase family protein [Candidatus Omnitrophota bacterium]